MKTATRIVHLLLVACTTGAFAVACSCGEEQKPPKPAAQPAQPAPPAATPAPPVRPPPGPAKVPSLREQLEKKVSLPPFYPKDAPAYPGTTPSEAGTRQGRIYATFSTTDGIDEVTGWTQEFLDSNGWRVLPAQPMGAGSVLQGQKSGRVIAVMISTLKVDGEPHTLMMVSVTP